MKLIAETYQVEHLLSEGKGGTVYIARPRGLAHAPQCVVKTLAIQSDEHQAQFEREMPLLVSLSAEQEHIAEVYEQYGIDEDKGLYSVMEVLQGESLEQLLRRESHLPLLPSLRLFLQLCEAMAAAHETGLVHRHLSPARLMLVQQFLQTEPILKVVDFGVMLPPLLLLPTDPVFLEELRAWGDPLYLAPELWNGAEASPASDQYAMGCILFEMLTGEAPFFLHKDDMLTLSIAHRARTPEPLQRFQASMHYPEALNDVLSRSLSKAPEDRFSNILEMAEELQSIMDSLGELSEMSIPDLPAADSEELMMAFDEELPPLEASTTAWLVQLIRDPLEPDEDFYTALAVEEVSSVMVLAEDNTGGTVTSIHELPTTLRDSELELEPYGAAPVKQTMAYGAVSLDDDENMTREWEQPDLVDLEVLLPTESGSQFDAVKEDDGDATVAEMIITSPLGFQSPFEDEAAPAVVIVEETSPLSETEEKNGPKPLFMFLLVGLIVIVGGVLVAVLMNFQ